MSKVFKKTDLMKRWGISNSTMTRWLRDKDIPHYKNKVNGRVYFDKEEIEEWEKEMLYIGNQD